MTEFRQKVYEFGQKIPERKKRDTFLKMYEISQKIPCLFLIVGQRAACL